MDPSLELIALHQPAHILTAEDGPLGDQVLFEGVQPLFGVVHVASVSVHQPDQVGNGIIISYLQIFEQGLDVFSDVSFIELSFDVVDRNG
jgi:hypothetical protein